MSKLILHNQEIINIVVTTLIGPEGLNVYTSRPTDWPDGTKSDVLYAPSVVSTSFPPMLVEIQHTIDQTFIDRLLN
ncbi:hypothetical protein BDF21DRAFT_466742 [Thamnidium elegans]|uniref:Uncharacterized protein n=1 Tax=Thamnidium elegans TaxID=101142 RepID=A0A8H7SS40_9FUNG|nr:hypothetical protein INT48_007743 [Thamnidium elegans]KAI8064058.1 hypothetical protein BDF21DRAFT_466742 [Thamnidium elegans]